MSKFYLPSSTPASTTSPSPLQSPTSLTTPTATSNLRQLPSDHNNSHTPASSQRRDPDPYRYTDTASTPSYDDYDSDDDDDLPYPTPLPRTAFHDPAFDPQLYLSTLRNRHQTLEDLRTELRERVRDLGRELYDLVNAEYEDLMGVGLILRGGEEKVEGVRVGVLGFRREVEGLRGAVRGSKEEVGRAVRERQVVRERIVLGRRLLEVGERTEELARRLGVEVGGEEERVDGVEEDEVNEDDDDDEGDGLGRLKGNARLYLQLKGLIEKVGKHPFLDGHAEKLKAIREALLLDLGASLRSSRKGDDRDSLVKVIAIYRDIGEATEAVRILKAK